MNKVSYFKSLIKLVLSQYQSDFMCLFLAKSTCLWFDYTDLWLQESHPSSAFYKYISFFLMQALGNVRFFVAHFQCIKKNTGGESNLAKSKC